MPEVKFEQAPYEHMNYPKHLYHPNGSAKEVQNDAEMQKALAEGYVESPADYGYETCPAAPPVLTSGFRAMGFTAPAQSAQPAQVAPPEAHRMLAEEHMRAAKEAEKAAKEAEKATKDAEKDAEKAARDVEKEAEKAARDAEKAAREVEKEAEKAAREVEVEPEEAHGRRRH